MIIRLSLVQQKTLIDWGRKITRAHLDVDCEPPDYELVISTHVMNSVVARCGAQALEFGDVEIVVEKID